MGFCGRESCGTCGPEVSGRSAHIRPPRGIPGRSLKAISASRLGIKGRARTLRLRPGQRRRYAIIHAAETIARGQADVVIAGGTEQPLSPYAWLCCQTGAFLTPAGNADPQAAYRPFDRAHGGTVIGEGSVFLVLESEDHARARGAGDPRTIVRLGAEYRRLHAVLHQ